MNTTLGEAKKLIEELKTRIDKIENLEKIICPPFISLTVAKDRLKGTSLKLGAQNCYPDDFGSFTGEVSVAMLKDLVEYVIVGHSERREILWENDEFINEKILKLLELGLKPILCVGELEMVRESGQEEPYLANQLEKALKGVTDEQVKNLVLAYEPVWAIGSGKTASPEIANNAIAFLRRKIESLYSGEVAENLITLYGGSVKTASAKELIEMPSIDGFLVGGASIDAQEFTGICEVTAESR